MTTSTKQDRPRIALGGDGARVLIIGGEKIARIRQRGVGKFVTVMEDGRDLGAFRTRNAAIEAALAAR